MEKKTGPEFQICLSSVVLTTTLSMVSSLTHAAPILTIPQSLPNKQNTQITRACDLSVGVLPPNAKLDDKSRAYLNSALTLLTPMWAQEAIGGPESLQYMNEFEKANPNVTLRWVPVGISDGNFQLKDLPVEKLNNELKKQLEIGPVSKEASDLGEHAYSVATLISDMNGFGTGYRSYLSWFEDRLSRSKKSSAFGQAEVKPWFVNRSIEKTALTNTDADSEILKMSKQSIVVAAAGNQFPWPTDKGSYPAIVVGAVDQFGLMASFSRQGSAVDVTAPGASILVYLGKDKLSLVHGTSFATPLVTGVLSSVASMLPGITLAELREMIKRTAIPTAAYTFPTTGDGAGVINQYAMVRIAGRLVKSWPANRSQIHEAWPYDFRSEIAKRKAAIATQLNAKSNQHCSSQKSILVFSRQNFFLDPKDSETREVLSGVYLNSGFYSQAMYYNTPKNSASSAWVPLELNERRFQVAVSLGDIETMRTLSRVRIRVPEHLNSLLLIASTRGDTAALRFMLEDWYISGIDKGLRDEMFNNAFRGRHEEAMKYISSIVPKEPKPN